jgi:hypothetical protein
MGGQSEAVAAAEEALRLLRTRLTDVASGDFKALGAAFVEAVLQAQDLIDRDTTLRGRRVQPAIDWMKEVFVANGGRVPSARLGKDLEAAFGLAAALLQLAKC